MKEIKFKWQAKEYHLSQVGEQIIIKSDDQIIYKTEATSLTDTALTPEKITSTSEKLRKNFWIEKNNQQRVITWPGGNIELAAQTISYSQGDSAANANALVLTMPGKVLDIKVKQGDKVKKGECLVIVEAMKMENNLSATKDTEIKRINVAVGDSVESGAVLIEFAEE